MMPKVVVVTALYNQAQFIAQTIESVLDQDYRGPLEHIIVDDASTDNSLQIAKQYEERFPDRVRVVRNEVNRMLPASRNAGINATTSDLVLPLDSDDRLMPNYLSRTVPYFGNERMGMVSTYFEFAPEPDMLAKGHAVAVCGPPNSAYPLYKPTREQILNGNCLPVVSLLRRSMLTELGNYPEIMNRGSEDWALWAKIVFSGKWDIFVLPEVLFRYRIHKDSMCRSNIMEPNFEITRQKIRTLCGQ